jgi:hypothetical protein
MCKTFVTIHAEHMQNNIYFMMCNKSIQKKLKKQSVESNMQTEKISCKYMEKQTHQNMQIFDPKYA